MIYAQIRSGRKLHLAYEAGEGDPIVKRGFLSQPICGIKAPNGYRMTCNLPLAHSCQRCQRVLRSKP